MRLTTALCVCLLPLLIGCGRPAQPRVSLETYDRLNPGMTLQQVAAVAGPPTQAQAGSADDVTAAVLLWLNNDHSYMIVVVQDEQVVAKVQADLPAK